MFHLVILPCALATFKFNRLFIYYNIKNFFVRCDILHPNNTYGAFFLKLCFFLLILFGWLSTFLVNDKIATIFFYDCIFPDFFVVLISLTLFLLHRH